MPDQPSEREREILGMLSRNPSRVLTIDREIPFVRFNLHVTCSAACHRGTAGLTIARSHRSVLRTSVENPTRIARGLRRARPQYRQLLRFWPNSFHKPRINSEWMIRLPRWK